MSTILEARAIISAEDRTAEAFSRVEARVAALSKHAAEVGKVGAAVGRVTQAAEGQGRALAAQGQAVAQASAAVSRYSGAMANVSRAMGGATLLAAPVVAGKAKAFAHEVKETYREFDDLRRYQKAILGLSDEEQKPLINQALHLGASTRFNDLQVLHAQLDLAQRGLGKDVIAPITEAAAHFAQALGSDLPTAAKTLEGILFSTGKNVHDGAGAVKEAEKAASFATKLAKIGGLSEEDIRQLFKYGGQPASAAGLSDSTFGALAALMRRNNIRGDEAGVAIRALSGKLYAPTGQALTALNAYGIDYSDFVKVRDKAFTADNMGLSFARSFGRGLSQDARARLGQAIAGTYERTAADGKTEALPILGDMQEFIKAVSAATEGDFAKTKSGKLRQTDANKLAKWAASFYSAATENVDSEGLLKAIMTSGMGASLSAMNAMFTRQQGGRLMTGLKNFDQFGEYKDKLDRAGDNFHRKISDERMAGFAGALARLEGATKNLETAFGRANDPWMTAGANLGAKAIQGFVELGEGATRAATAVGGLATAFLAAEASLKALSMVNALSGNASGAAAVAGIGGGAVGRAALLGRLGLYGLAAYGGYKLGEGVHDLGGVAAGKYWAPKEAGDVADLKAQLGAIEAKIDGALGRVHPAMRDAPNPEIEGLRAQAQDLRNRIAAALPPAAAPEATAFRPVGSGLNSFGFGVGGSVAPKNPIGIGEIGSLKATVEGPVTAELKGEGNVNVSVRIEAGSELIRVAGQAASAASSGHIRANVGVGHAETSASGARSGGQ